MDRGDVRLSCLLRKFKCEQDQQMVVQVDEPEYECETQKYKVLFNLSDSEMKNRVGPRNRHVEEMTFTSPSMPIRDTLTILFKFTGTKTTNTSMQNMWSSLTVNECDVRDLNFCTVKVSKLSKWSTRSFCVIICTFVSVEQAIINTVHPDITSKSFQYSGHPGSETAHELHPVS